MEEATEYCIKNKCKGYNAIPSGLFPLIKDPRTINRRLGTDSQGKERLVTGEEKAYCTILTEKEEKSLVNFLLNMNRCRQGLSEKEVGGGVLNILRARQAVNKKGGRKLHALSKNAK